MSGSRLAELDDANRAFNEMLIGMRQREILRDSFGKFVPEAIAEQYLQGEGVLEPVTRTATMLFTDIEGFSTIAERMSPRALIELLNEYFAALITPIEAHGGVIHQFQGDAILATFNLPVEDPQHAAADQEAAVRQAIVAGDLAQPCDVVHRWGAGELVVVVL